SPGKELRHGALHLDLDSFSASWNGASLTLTVTEFAILRTLAAHPGKVFTRDNLMNSAYDDRRFVSDRTIDSHVRRVRTKLREAGGDPIETVHGLGYKLRAT
ncbi:MAG TPA: winged helix-turn-helix domain-containing protein, partial [Caldimonas sp.]|nr:winged helix-turn-helix domain-containing protein [Caldimonas sp.]